MIIFRVWDKINSRFLPSDKIVIGNEVLIIYDTFGQTVINRNDPDYILSFSIDKKDIHGQDIYEGDIVLCYKWFDGSENKPRQKSQHIVTASIETNMDPTYEGGWDGTWNVEEIEIIGNIYEKINLYFIGSVG